MSMGYLIGDEAPVVWRGLMVMKALQQLLHEVDWGGLDILVLDLPPGTGDTQLTITQQIVLDGKIFISFGDRELIFAGAIIVSTPQDIALKDAVKGINMFKKTNIPILGMVQNMSLFTCPHCHNRTHIFGSHPGVANACQEHGIEFLGDIPLHANICDDADRGKPTVVSEPDSDRAKSFIAISLKVGEKVGL
jgi:ATP-binding protein involved in chromosome partitioning